MKLTVDSRLAQRWTFLLCDDEDEQTAVGVVLGFFLNPQLSRTQKACFSPPSGPNTDLRLTWTRSDREPVPDGRTPGAVRSVSSSPPFWNPLIALPRDCSERLPFWWTSTFFKWPYLSLKKKKTNPETFGDGGRGNVIIFCPSMCSIVGFVLNTVYGDTGHLWFSVFFSWWSLYYVKASVP